jgi:hypothetical protein
MKRLTAVLLCVALATHVFAAEPVTSPDGQIAATVFAGEDDGLFYRLSFTSSSNHEMQLRNVADSATIIAGQR